jgi:hypothetical protein
MTGALIMLEARLDMAFQAIRTADFARLAALTAETEHTLAQIGTAGDEAVLQRIRQKAQRNATCLLAAGRGIKAARRRLEEVAGARAGLGTYDSAGQRSTLFAAPSTAAHRA